MICTIVSAVAGVIGTLMVLVVAMASGANSTPRQIRQIKLTMLITVILGIACVVGGVMLTNAGHPWWGCGVAAAPAIFVFVAIVWLSVDQVRNQRPPRR